MNGGSEPLEPGCARWDRSRAEVHGETAILYDSQARGGGATALAVRSDPRGRIDELAVPPRARLPASQLWRIARSTRCDPGGDAHLDRTIEDRPFYVRSVVRTRLWGRGAGAVHDSLNLDRFASGWVQTLLPLRLPRVLWSAHNSERGNST